MHIKLRAFLLSLSVHHGSEGSHQTEQKRNNKEGVSAEGRQRTGGWSAVGGELLLRRGMIFLRLYILGLYLTWSSGNLQEQQLRALLQPGQGGLREGTDEITLEKERVSLWLRPWKVEAVGCNLWLRRQQAPIILLLLLSQTRCCP